MGRFYVVDNIIEQKYYSNKDLIKSISVILADSYVINFDSVKDAVLIIILLAKNHNQQPKWRQYRPYILAESAMIYTQNISYNHSTEYSLKITGFLRSSGISFFMILKIPGIGIFQISKITSLKDLNKILNYENDMNYKKFIKKITNVKKVNIIK